MEVLLAVSGATACPSVNIACNLLRRTDEFHDHRHRPVGGRSPFPTYLHKHYNPFGNHLSLLLFLHLDELLGDTKSILLVLPELFCTAPPLNPSPETSITPLRLYSRYRVLRSNNPPTLHSTHRLLMRHLLNSNGRESWPA